MVAQEEIFSHPHVMRYIKNKKNQRVGVLLAFKENDTVKLGWSQCNKLDRFNKNFGISKAFYRSKPINELKLENVTHTVKQHLDSFMDRVTRYFKLEG